MSERNKQAARRLIEIGFNEKDLRAYDEFFDAGLVNHELPPDMPQGLEGTKMFASMFMSAFPNIRVRVEDLLAEEDRVVTRWSARGLHEGELMGIPPTGNEIHMTGIAIDRFEGGKSVEHWEIFDQMGLMQQLGVVPGPG